MSALTRKERQARALESYENGMILALHRIAGANMRIAKSLAVGCTDSEIVGAILDLRNAASNLESSRLQYSKSMQSLAEEPA